VTDAQDKAELLSAEIRHLRDLLEAHKELDNLRHAEEQKSLAAAEVNLDRRLDTMNQFREQLTAERGHYVNRELHDKMESTVMSKIDKIDFDMDGRLKILETYAANVQGRIWAMGAGITIIVTGVGAIIQIALYWFHYHQP
jgi:hypothetical protein